MSLFREVTITYGSMFIMFMGILLITDTIPKTIFGNMISLLFASISTVIYLYVGFTPEKR